MPLFVFLTGAVSLSEYLFAWDAGIDEFFLKDTGAAGDKYPGRISPITAISFVLLGISLFMFPFKKLIWLRISEFTSIAALLIAFAAIIGYLYRSSHLYQIFQFVSIALHTALSILLLALGIISSKPQTGFLAAFNKNTNAARIGSREVIVLIAIVVVVGWLRLKLQDAGHFDTQFGVSVIIIIFSITFFFTTWVGTTRLNRLELEQKKADNQILNNERRFREVLGIIGDNVWEHDFATGKTYFEETIQELLGYSNNDTNDNINLWWKNTHPDDRWMLEENDKNYKAGISNSHNIEYRIYHKNGSLRWVLDRGVVLSKDENGMPLRIIGTHTDITARRENELLLKKLNEELLKSTVELKASNEDLEQFAYVASHDLQEPARMVGSFLHLLKKKYHNELDETAIKYIDLAVDGAGRMKILINDLLSFSRVGASKEEFKQVDLTETLKNVLTSLQPVIKESGAIIHISKLPVINGNAPQIDQLFQNLLGNAIKYRSHQVPVVEVGCQEYEDEYEFFVKDNGIGFDNRYSDKVFVIFQRLHTKQEYSGTGIGLAICKRIVERHGGKIRVDAEPGKGSNFYFTISKQL